MVVLVIIVRGLDFEDFYGMGFSRFLLIVVSTLGYYPLHTFRKDLPRIFHDLSSPQNRPTQGDSNFPQTKAGGPTYIIRNVSPTWQIPPHCITNVLIHNLLPATLEQFSDNGRLKVYQLNQCDYLPTSSIAILRNSA